MRLLVLSLLCLAPLGGASVLESSLMAQSAPITTPVPTTKVLAIGHVIPGPDPQAMRAIMPNEVRDTVQLYLDGKLDQWFVRQDGKGVVFLLNATSEAEAREMLSKLPLVKAGRMEFDLMPLGPLSPLRYLMGDAGNAAK
jgi:hypothetical protein